MSYWIPYIVAGFIGSLLADLVKIAYRAFMNRNNGVRGFKE